MAMAEQVLAQKRQNGTGAVSVYSPGASEIAIIKTIVLCNTSGATATFRLFLDDDGSTYDESTALAWDVTLNAGQSQFFHTFIAMDTAAGNFAYRSSVANAITITLSGAVIT